MTTPQAIKKAQGYEQNPPRCGNCQHFRPGQWAIPGERPFQPTSCGLGLFACNPKGICNHWLGRDGSTLEPSA